jgi:hypothetical protein
MRVSYLWSPRYVAAIGWKLHISSRISSASRVKSDAHVKEPNPNSIMTVTIWIILSADNKLKRVLCQVRVERSCEMIKRADADVAQS